MKEQLEENRLRRTDVKENHDLEIDKSLDKFSFSLIKVVGIIGVIIGFAIIIAFWYWVIKMLFKVGA
jgi:hypothetical protein